MIAEKTLQRRKTAMNGRLNRPRPWLMTLLCAALGACITLGGVTGCTRLANNPSSADPNALQIGDPAPPLSLSRFVMGEPVSGDLSGKIHVVEFWATWCPPCRASMPHLSGLQTQYAEDVTFIGVTDEDVATVESFLEQPSPEEIPWSELITYRLATDSGRATYSAYMQAAGQTGIPTAFIVDGEGVIRWIGHPLDIDAPLHQLVEQSKRPSRA